jgi:AraC family transcriptional regulator
MEPKIIKKDAFTVIGAGLKTTLSDETDFGEIPKFWEKVLRDGLIDMIPNKKHPDTVLGISMNIQPDGSFLYIIGAEVSSAADISESMVCKTVPAAEYAVFTARGQIPGSIQETSKYIYKEWLPNSGYKRAETAEFELYDERCQRGEKSEVDIYIPIIPS